MSTDPKLKCELMHHNQCPTSPDWMKSGHLSQTTQGHSEMRQGLMSI